MIKRWIIVIYILSIQCAEAACTGKFINPITDICWECIFPITLGGIELVEGINDTDNPESPICMCPGEGGIPRIGVSIGFWEPVRLVDVTKDPFCFPALGGIQMGGEGSMNVGTAPNRSRAGNASWHVHWYIYPLIYWLELLTDFACLEQSTFDIAYLTELDPVWLDDGLAAILNPEAILFGNLVAVSACALDCASSSFNRPIDSLFWCAGCQGGMYPMSGHVTHVNSIQSALLATERFTFKLHRQLLAEGTSGKEALCSKYPMPFIKKSQYRTQLVVPSSSDCYAFGHTTTTYESNKEIPISGEDFSFLIWRKRNCCAF